MSVSDSTSRKRSVVPRWRSFLNTPTVEMIPAERFTDHPPLTSAAFFDLLKIWRGSGRAEDFVDIMDAGIASGSRLLALEGARKVLSFGSRLRARVASRAEAILFNRPTLVSRADVPLHENSAEDLVRKIARLKETLRESPRNALAHIEIARLYLRLAQFDPALKHVEIAISLAPNDRFILRAATRFFTVVDQTALALHVLRKSDAVKYDPWVQSAELSAAELIGRETRHAERAARTALNQKSIPRHYSELVAGWVSKISLGGLKARKSFQLLSKTLGDPTENALAQGVWLVENLHSDFRDKFPSVHPSADAHEAKSILLTEAGDFRTATTEAAKWFVDQPFQARAAIQLAFLKFAHLHDYRGAREAAEQGLRLHPKDWCLLNHAILSNIYCGDMERAQVHLDSFERFATGDEQNSFLEAARGMLAFETGRPDAAVEHYLQAMRIARRMRNSSLNINAAIYMLEMASRHGLIVADDIKYFEEIIAKAIKSLSKTAQRDAERMWGSRKRLISSAIANFPFIPLNYLKPDLIENNIGRNGVEL